MFILPAPVSATALQLELALPASPAWVSSLSMPYIRLALVLLTTLAILALVRVVLCSRAHAVIPVALAVEKAGTPVATVATNEKTAEPAVGHTRWLARLLSWKKKSSLSDISASAPSMALSRTLPLAIRPSVAPPMRGQRGVRGVGLARRPEVPRALVDVPLPALFQCQTPASMAKAIMSRHTHRRPSAIPSSSSRRSTPSSLTRSVSHPSPSAEEGAV
ncbi:unnamed protein product [Mycena citricolor]|uniref:Uncharacterized protein n=1 Tax=Mycena citricolor TaxID=2018698 RepID=A0AAD2HLR2_9AGAR|nr:unnamed protein product [Mycena citricolor]